VLGNNTRSWTFKAPGEEPVGSRPHLRLTAPSGEVWTYNSPSKTDLVEGLAEQLRQVVPQTRNISDMRLRGAGAAAASWMSKAQCFAGAAEAPPAPGTQRTRAA
jgi:hypothetical protein